MLKVSSDFRGLGRSLASQYHRLLTDVTPTGHAAEMIKATTILRKSIVCAYVRMWTGGRAIDDVPPTSLEQTLIGNLIGRTPVVMGQRAFDHIGYRMQGRHTLRVVTHDPDERAFEGDGKTVFVPSPSEAIQQITPSGHGPDMWVWGGASIYSALLPYCDHVVALKTRGARGGAALFPALPITEWREVFSEALPKVIGEDHQFTLVIHGRKPT